MNARFLFRGKTICDGKWLTGNLSVEPDGTAYIGNLHNYRSSSANVAGAWTQVDILTVGQCTGLAAAKSYRGDTPEDLLVCEGDVFQLGHIEINYIVVWHDTALMGKHLHSSSYVGLEHWLEQIVITGTIHDKYPRLYARGEEQLR